MQRKARLNIQQDPNVPGVFVGYYRVSTRKQGASGLGLEAQKEAVARYIASVGGSMVNEFKEVESGHDADRPELENAFAVCRLHRATLVVAKLDRLSRDSEEIAGYIKRARFKCADMPDADVFQLHIYAALAEQEARAISARTKAALAAAKARGVQLGNPRLQHGTRDQAIAAAAAKVRQADERAADRLPIIRQVKAAGISSFNGIAKALNARGVPTVSGSGAWTQRAVARVIARGQDTSPPELSALRIRATTLR